MINIRPALEGDWPQFYPFLIGDDKPLDSLEAAFARFKHKIASALHCVLVAKVKGQIVGIAMAHE